MEDEIDYEERRKHQRIHTRIEIPYWKYVKFKRSEEIHIGFVKDLSMGGFFVETEVVYDLGIEVGFEFYLANSPNPVAGVAIVKWKCDADVVDDDPNKMPGMGVEFKHFERDSEQILEDFIRNEIAKQKT